MNNRTTEAVESYTLTEANLRKSKGITLIALVITIIVLLILAGIAISMLNGEDGILKKAVEAKTKTENTEENEKIAMAVLEAKMNETAHALSKDEVMEQMGGDIEIENYNNNIVSIKKFTDGVVPIPKGMAYAIGDSVDNGIVIVDRNGNEFVWVPVENFTDFAEEDTTSEEGIINYKSITYIFNEDGTYEKNSKSHEPSTAVENDIGIGEKYDGSEINRRLILDEGYENSLNGLKRQFQDEYNSMAISIKTYKGFYVGRYETGWDGNKVTSIKDVRPMTARTFLEESWRTSDSVDGSIISEQNQNRATWYGLYKKQKELYYKDSNIGVRSGMIYGAQWDAIMRWMSNVKNIEDNNKYYITCGLSMGFYRNNQELNSKQFTGLNVNGIHNKVKNIYDMAGNMCEWTQEGRQVRVVRGGFYNTSAENKGASYKDDNYVPTNTENSGFFSSRLQLYIK